MHDRLCQGTPKPPRCLRATAARCTTPLKLEGIVRAPWASVSPATATAPARWWWGTHMKTMDLYSSVCAVQNLWLAARARRAGCGLGQHLPPGRAAGGPGHPQRASRPSPTCAWATSATSSTSPSWKPPSWLRPAMQGAGVFRPMGPARRRSAADHAAVHSNRQRCKATACPHLWPDFLFYPKRRI